MVSALVSGSNGPGSREVTCDGLATSPGGVKILLAASCCRNREL